MNENGNKLFLTLYQLTKRGYSIDIRKEPYVAKGTVALRVSIVNDVNPRKKITFVQTYHNSYVSDIGADDGLFFEIDNAIKALELEAVNE